MRSLFPLPIALAFVTSACTNPPPPTMRTLATRTLTPTQLISTIDTRKGQTVTVAGYFTDVTDTRALWENESARRDAEQLREGSWDKCITIYPSSANARLFNRQHVHITGKATIIGKDDIRSLWTCNDVALENASIRPAE